MVVVVAAAAVVSSGGMMWCGVRLCNALGNPGPTLPGNYESRHSLQLLAAAPPCLVTRTPTPFPSVPLLMGGTSSKGEEGNVKRGKHGTRKVRRNGVINCDKMNLYCEESQGGGK